MNLQEENHTKLANSKIALSIMNTKTPIKWMHLVTYYSLTQSNVLHLLTFVSKNFLECSKFEEFLEIRLLSATAFLLRDIVIGHILSA